MMTLTPEALAQAIFDIDAWLDSMRGECGYGGPVAHRWQDSLIYAGPGFDWRYEGIITSYLRLHQVTGEPRWLLKACRAGDDLLSAQLPDGRFRVSSFEDNPASGGTPHEAACDLALLRLAAYLKNAANPVWESYLIAARRNLLAYYLQKLWDPSRRSFCNLPGDVALVPNKISTLVEAGFALSAMDEKVDLLEQYFLPALSSVLTAQVQQNGSRLRGAIDQSLEGGHPSERNFPYYAARCIPALLQAYQYKREQIYLDAAVNAMDFILRCQLPDGSFPQVLYANGRQTTAPRWIAACGDILRAGHLLAAYGYSSAGLDLTQDWLLSGLLPSGGIRTASGFAALESPAQAEGLPDFRDLLPVCGWVDKAFSYFAMQVQPGLPAPASSSPHAVSMPCRFKGREATFFESETCIEVMQKGKVLYHWQKGTTWAQIW